MGTPALDTVAHVADRAARRALSGTVAFLNARAADAKAEIPPRRVFPIKGGTNRVKTADDTRAAPSRKHLSLASGMLRAALHRRLQSLPALGATHVDPELRHRLVPFNRRGDSASAIPVTKGSAYPMDDAPVLRMFVHWTGEVDVDLSLNVHDENWALLDSVAFYNTKSTGMVHSGDVQNAPEGASEFIDVELASLQQGARFLVPSIISYRGNKFSSFPCYVGYMGRDRLRSSARYEPQSVLLKFDAAAATRSMQPVAFDVVARRVICMDLAMGGGCFGTASGQHEAMADAARAVMRMRERRVTLWDVAAPHAAARGVLVGRPEEARTVFSAATSMDVFEALLDVPVPSPACSSKSDSPDRG